MFELKLNDKTIQLKWGTYAMRLFCEKRNITIDKYFEVLGNTQLDLDIVIKLIYIGYLSASISKEEEVIYNEVNVCDWIDEIGSIFTSEGQVMDYIKYIVSTTVYTLSGTPKEEEKKKSSKAKLG